MTEPTFTASQVADQVKAAVMLWVPTCKNCGLPIHRIDLPAPESPTMEGQHGWLHASGIGVFCPPNIYHGTLTRDVIELDESTPIGKIWAATIQWARDEKKFRDDLFDLLEWSSPKTRITAKQALDRAIQSAVAKATVELRHTLEEVRELIEGYVDVLDGANGQPRPNKAMVAVQIIEDILGTTLDSGVESK